MLVKQISDFFHHFRLLTMLWILKGMSRTTRPWPLTFWSGSSTQSWFSMIDSLPTLSVVYRLNWQHSTCTEPLKNHQSKSLTVIYFRLGFYLRYCCFCINSRQHNYLNVIEFRMYLQICEISVLQYRYRVLHECLFWKYWIVFDTVKGFAKNCHSFIQQV